MPMVAASVSSERKARLLGGFLDWVNKRQVLEQRAAEAESACRAKDEFIAMLSHELRNPLARIVSSLELMRLNGADEHEQAVMERQVRHLSRLVDDLLDVTRIRSGGVELRKRPMEMAEIVAAAAEMVDPLLRQRCHALEVEVPRNLVVDADPERMSQVVVNLLINAAKFSDEGSPIFVSATAEDGKARLSIVDRGIGIDATRLEKVFDSFVRSLDRMPSGPNEGLGLGLAIARNLTRLHGGEVRARSDGPGKGSELIVELPHAGRAEASCR